MKKYQPFGLMLGATLLQMVYFGSLECVPGQSFTTADQPNSTVPASFSPAVAEVVRLAQSGIGDEAVIDFVKRAQGRFGLSEEAIIYLKDLGLSPEVITAMLRHDGGSPADSTRLAASVAPATTADPVSENVPENVATAQETGAPADVNYFYTQLSPYGTWASIEGVGWCWQPHCHSFSRGWRPYCHGGRWVYTDCGWYWQSDYSWGWAPFHYGRWHQHPRCGWVWCPGREWAPAWVTWRVSNGHCGWAALPPHCDYVKGHGWRHRGIYCKDNYDFGLKHEHFTFIATKDFNSRELARHQLAVNEARNVYERAATINARPAAQGKILVNAGVPVHQVAAATHADFREIPIRTVLAGTAQQNGGGAPVVFRHELRAPAKPLKLVVPRVDEKHPVLVHPSIVPGGVQHNEPVRPNGILRKGQAGPGAGSPEVPPRQNARPPATPGNRFSNGNQFTTRPPSVGISGSPSVDAPAPENSPGRGRPNHPSGRPPIQRPRAAAPGNGSNKTTTPPGGVSQPKP